MKAPLVTDEAAAELEMIDLCEEDQPSLKEGTIEFWKSVPIEEVQTGCTQDTVRVWVNILLRVCVFYCETCEIKASVCID